MEEVTPATPEAQIKALHELRLKKNDLILEKSRRQLEFDRECADLLVELSETNNEIALQEEGIKAAAILAYEATGSKVPFVGVTVKVFAEPAYPDDKALEWAQEHKMCLVPEHLDKKAFEKDVCRSDALRPDFVGMIERAQAQISTDLSNAVGEVGL